MITKKVARQYCEEEYHAHIIYGELAKREKNPDRRKILEKLGKQEIGHYNFWRKYAPDCRPSVGTLQLYWIIFLRYAFGLTFTLKLMERTEKGAVEGYKKSMHDMPAKDRKALRSMIDDEEKHEKYFMSQLNETVVKYMSFIVLGLSDAIVEITGVHTGFLGVTSSTLIAGVAGLVVGFAAAISMASAAYIQAKQDPDKSPIKSAVSTGLAYFGAVAVLAMPYFFIHSMTPAFLVSLFFAMVLTAAFTFYGAVLNEKSFKREFAETAALILATALLAFLFGEFLGTAFGVRQFI